MYRTCVCRVQLYHLPAVRWSVMSVRACVRGVRRWSHTNSLATLLAVCSLLCHGGILCATHKSISQRTKTHTYIHSHNKKWLIEWLFTLPSSHGQSINGMRVLTSALGSQPRTIAACSFFRRRRSCLASRIFSMSRGVWLSKLFSFSLAPFLIRNSMTSVWWFSYAKCSAVYLLHVRPSTHPPIHPSVIQSTNTHTSTQPNEHAQ